MGSKYIELEVPVEYTDEDLRRKIRQKFSLTEFNYTIDLKSLDARKKQNLHWQLRVLITSPEISEEIAIEEEQLKIEKTSKQKNIIVVGMGPAGYFAADILNRAGHHVTILEGGADTERRLKAIREFEAGGEIGQFGNYVFGEGGAGTFSDGKLTSRTKGISAFKKHVIDSYIEAGAPEEIRYLSKPHIGSNNLRKMMPVLRDKLLNRGVTVSFETLVTDMKKESAGMWKIITSRGEYCADIVVFATGHTAYNTFRMLFSKGVAFTVKPFAIGVRVEHRQEIVNKAQWGKPLIKGLNSADYVLRWQGQQQEACYSFCMCPGGKVVQAAPGKGQSIVNGMSFYQRNSPYANSGIVVPFDIRQFLGHEISPEQAIAEIEKLEQKVWNLQKSFAIPANLIADFMKNKVAARLPETTYSHGVFPFEFRELFDKNTALQLVEGLKNFSLKIHGFEKGMMMGLESKTSSAIQVVRDEQTMMSASLDGIYVVGEGSGFAGGIISSAVDGMRVAMKIR